MTLHVLRDHRPVRHVPRGELGRGPIAPVAMGHRPRPTTLERQAGLGPIQCLDLAPLLQTKDQCAARGIRVQTDDIPHSSTNSGSVLSLKRLTTWGFNPLAAQIRCTVAELIPSDRAIERTLQCVAPRGFSCSGASTTRQTLHSESAGLLRPRDRPRVKLCDPSSLNLRRHTNTVGRDTPSCAAIERFDTPAPAASTFLPRSTARS